MLACIGFFHLDLMETGIGVVGGFGCRWREWGPWRWEHLYFDFCSFFMFLSIIGGRSGPSASIHFTEKDIPRAAIHYVSWTAYLKLIQSLIALLKNDSRATNGRYDRWGLWNRPRKQRIARGPARWWASFLPREAHNPQGTISLHWRPTSWTDSLSLLDNCQPSLGLPMFQALCWPFYLLYLPDHPRRYVISLYQIMTKTDLMFCEVTLYGQDNSPLVESLRFIVVAQSLSHIQLFATSWAAACQVSWSFTTSQVRWVGDVIQHLSPPSPLALNLSQHQRFHS